MLQSPVIQLCSRLREGEVVAGKLSSKLNFTTTLNLNGHVIEFKDTKLMGIISYSRPTNSVFLFSASFQAVSSLKCGVTLAWLDVALYRLYRSKLWAITDLTRRSFIRRFSIALEQYLDDGERNNREF